MPEETNTGVPAMDDAGAMTPTPATSSSDEMDVAAPTEDVMEETPAAESEEAAA